MRIEGKVATWLEMVATPHLHRKNLNLKLHPVEETARADAEDRCYAISVDGRWLCSNNGSLTVLQGMEAAKRFMRLIRNESFESGEPMPFAIDCSKNAHCIALGRDKRLRGCGRSQDMLS